MGWKGITRSLQGTRHRQQGIPCQDFGAHWIGDDVVIGAIAKHTPKSTPSSTANGVPNTKDGVLGAKLAVTTLVDYLKSSDQWLRSHNASWTTIPTDALAGTTRRCFSKGIKAVQTALDRQAQTQQCSIDDFACTLLAFLATPQWIAAFQIGGGFMVIRAGDRSVLSKYSDLNMGPYTLLFDAHNPGADVHSTDEDVTVQDGTQDVTAQDVTDQDVTAQNAPSTFQTEVFMVSPTFICASTDGLTSVSIRQRDAFPFPPFFRPLEEYMEETANPEQDDRYIMTFLQSDRLNQRTNDDKTLLLCRHES